MRTLYYLPLESYQARYSYQLLQWNEAVFRARGIDYVVVPGENLDDSQAISVGQVLDAHGRSYFAMSQIMNLVKLMREGKVTSSDIIYLEDMFQPGIEALPYIINQVQPEYRPQIFVRCLAQAIDPDDFVHVTGMAKWMSAYEQLVNCFVTGILATNEEMVAHARIANWNAPIYNISGLAFGKNEVLGRVPTVKTWKERSNRVVFAARFDQEKQPDFFMDLIEDTARSHPHVEFAVLSGGPLRSNDTKYLARARRLEEKGLLSIYENLPKNEYYAILNDSKVLFNCALQDWVSNTVSEADTLGCNVLYPAYRSFPETFANDHERLYVPWSLADAKAKLLPLLDAPHKNMGKISDWNDGTISRILDIFEGKGDSWLRSGNRYRNHVATAKY